MTASCSHLLCDRERYPDLASALSTIRSYGFTAVDVGAFETWGQGLSPALLADDPDYASDVVQVLSASGLDVVSVNCAPGANLLGDEESEVERYAFELAALIRLAEETGAKRMTLQIPSRPKGLSDVECAEAFTEAWKRLIDRLDLARVVQKKGIRLSVEAHAGTFMEKVETALGVVMRLWPVLGFTYDPSHQVSIGLPLADTLPMIDYLVHAHIRDAARGKIQTAWGQGDLDTRWVLQRTFESLGLDAPVCIEYFGGFDPQFESARAAKADIEAFDPFAG